jgi:hypothetical protein
MGRRDAAFATGIFLMRVFEYFMRVDDNGLALSQAAAGPPVEGVIPLCCVRARHGRNRAGAYRPC